MTAAAEVAPAKPPYRVPLMAEIARMPWNGLTAASFFAGGGGSSTGYRMEGYRVCYANEIVPEARAAYKANMRDGTVLDGTDVRKVTGERVLEACGGALDLMDGSPPCQPFSTAGKRHKGWGEESAHADGTKQVSDDLFYEYARLLLEVRPRVFVAENVSGLVKGSAVGYFKRILARLRDSGYEVEARLLDAQWLGVPQARQRLIFVGVRDDLVRDGYRPVFPRPLPYNYTIRDALPNLAAYSFTTGGRNQARQAERGVDVPANSIGISGDNAGAAYHHKVAGPELEVVQEVTEHGEVATYGPGAPIGVTADGHDPENGYDVMLGDHAVAPEWDKLRPGQSSDRYFSLVRPHPDRPAPTVTAGANRRGVAGITHPLERRKLTIAELRRLCGFPDDFRLPGRYQDGWTRLGNAVPPPMIAAVARELRDRVLLPHGRGEPGPAT